MDTTENPKSADFVKLKGILKSLLKSYDVSQNETNIGLLTFGKTAKQLLPLASGINRVLVERSIDRAELQSSPRRASEPLILARKILVKAQIKGKSVERKPQVLLVMMGSNDPSDMDSFTRTVKQLEKDGIALFVLAQNLKKDDKALKDVVRDKADLILIDDTSKDALGLLEQRSGLAAGT